MNKDAFESAVLELWVKSAIPLTMANLQYHTGLPRRKVRPFVDSLVQSGVLDMDSDAQGELVFSVPGAQRNVRGPKSFAEFEHLRALSSQAGGPARGRRGRKRQKSAAGANRPGSSLENLRETGTAMIVANRARHELQGRGDANDKSVLLSAGLSMFLGPFGWFYAGSYREAAIGSVAFLALASILPQFLLLPLLSVLLPISGVAGLVYAWQHNRNGERGRILGRDDE
jgi:hypothetical protein